MIWNESKESRCWRNAQEETKVLVIAVAVRCLELDGDRDGKDRMIDDIKMKMYNRTKKEGKNDEEKDLFHCLNDVDCDAYVKYNCFCDDNST